MFLVHNWMLEAVACGLLKTRASKRDALQPLDALALDFLDALQVPCRKWLNLTGM